MEKVWFRELPQSLFNMVPEKHIYLVCNMQVRSLTELTTP